MMYRIILIILGIGPLYAHGQSLQQLLASAHDNSLQLQTLGLEYRAALEKAPQVSQLPDPEFGLGAFPLPVETRLGAQTARLSAMQMLPWFGTLDAKKDLESIKANLVLDQINNKDLEIDFKIKQAYYALQEMTRSQNVRQQNILILESLERLALSKVEAGVATAADVLRVQLNLEESRQEIELLEVAKRGPTAIINAILDRDIEAPVAIVEVLDFAELPLQIQGLKEEISNHPMIAANLTRQKIAEQSIVLNHLDAKPTVGLGLDYILVNERSDAVVNKNGRDIVQLKATMKIPLSRKRFDAREREEKLRISALQTNTTHLVNTFLSNIEEARSLYQRAQIQRDLYDKQIEITNATIRILESEYSAQGENFDEILRLTNDLVGYKLKTIKVITQSHVARSMIENILSKREG